MKKHLAFKHTGVPTVYLLIAVLAYVGAVASLLWFFFETLNTYRSDTIPENMGLNFIIMIVGVACMWIVTGSYYGAFQSSTGIAKPLPRMARKKYSFVRADELRMFSGVAMPNLGMHNTVDLKTGQEFFLIKDSWLTPFEWLNGYTAGNFLGKNMRALARVRVTDGTPRKAYRIAVQNGPNSTIDMYIVKETGQVMFLNEKVFAGEKTAQKNTAPSMQ